jgi:hypothetical protein
MVLAAAPAMAKPPVRPGVVTNMTFTATAPAYHLASTWSAGKNATSYQVKLTNASGTVLDTGRVTTLSWSDDIAPERAPLGSTLSLAVTSYNGTRKGPTATKSLVLRDVTAPQGSYTAVVSGYTATLSQVSLSDDSNGAVSRSVNWGDGTPTESWTTGGSLSHPYAGVGTYPITVTLKDPSGNTATETVKAAVVDRAPTGTFSVTKPGSQYKVTMTQVALSDDITPANSLTKVVDWGDGTKVNWTDANPLSHTYTPPSPTQIVHYQVSVTITDSARPTPNVAKVALPDVIVNDHFAPTGSFAVTTSKAWSRYTEVGLTESGVTDGLGSAQQYVVRTVNWGDGTPAQSWTTGAIPTHVYATDGSFPVTVTLKDESDNVSNAIAAGTVTVASDATAPVVKFRYPKKPRNVVKKWRTLRGTATDAGVGAKQVQLKVIEKRGRAWYAYKPGTHRWVKAGRMHRAWTKAGVSRMTPSATATWSKRVVGLRKGTLTYRARAVDNLGNTSGWLVHAQKLTR